MSCRAELPGCQLILLSTWLKDPFSYKHDSSLEKEQNFTPARIWGSFCFTDGAFQSYFSMAQFSFSLSYSPNTAHTCVLCLGPRSQGSHNLKGPQHRAKHFAAGIGLESTSGALQRCPAERGGKKGALKKLSSSDNQVLGFQWTNTAFLS